MEGGGGARALGAPEGREMEGAHAVSLSASL